MIAILDYGLGNIRAFGNVYKRLGISNVIASDPKDLEKASHVILPGVGAFDHAMNLLNKSGLRESLEQKAVIEKTPLLGICVGMQMLAWSSEEGKLAGLGFVDGHVRKFDINTINHNPKLPHMGWNAVEPAIQHPLLHAINGGDRAYFLHSFYFESTNEQQVLARSEYGGPFASVVGNGNVYGIQFHPEKSHQTGIQILKNFSTL